MAIYLVRHGQDEEGYRGGWSQRGLIDEGIRQAEKLGQYLNEHKHDFNVHRIVCGDLQRAYQTASILADKLSLPFHGSEDWREMNNGLLAGIPNSLAEEKFPGCIFRAYGWTKDTLAVKVRKKISSGLRKPSRDYARISLLQTIMRTYWLSLTGSD